MYRRTVATHLSTFLKTPPESQRIESFDTLGGELAAVVVLTLPTDPCSERRVFGITTWHIAVAMLGFEGDQCSEHLFPEGSVVVPDKPHFFQAFDTLVGEFVFLVVFTLRADPPPKNRTLHMSLPKTVFGFAE